MIITYILEKYGTEKVIGLGYAGNLLLICQAISNNLNSNEKLHMDWYYKGNCIVYDKLYCNDKQIVNPYIVD